MKSTAPKILDCTLRDGGYYTLWDFEDDLVERYLSGIRELPIDAVELGYLNAPQQGYSGRYNYLSPEDTAWAKGFLADGQKLGVMLNEKTVSPELAAKLVSGHEPSVDLVRMAVAPDRLDEAARIADVLTERGFEVGVNVMYLSKYWQDVLSLPGLRALEGRVSSIALVDSYGACTPSQVSSAIQALVHELPSTHVGFHGHDNLGLAVANSLSAADAGASIIDGTMTGMGRGPGNTRTETLAVHYASVTNNDLNYTALAQSVDAFADLHNEHRWGTNLVYMISGAAGLPQNNVMDWLGKKRYSIPAIIHALRGDVSPSELNDDVVATWQPDQGSSTVVILGGGQTARTHVQAVRRLAESTEARIIHATAKHLDLIQQLPPGQYLALAGDTLAQQPTRAAQENLDAILVPTGHRFEVKSDAMGDIPIRSVEPYVAKHTSSDLGPVSDIAPLALALGAAVQLRANRIHLIGFDGYENATLAQQELARETQSLIDEFIAMEDGPALSSATRTLYDLPVSSVYALAQQNNTAS